MHTLVDLLNHGILPFIGRSAELDTILRFWRSTFESSELRAMLVRGEAGIGKSRLLEEVVPQIVTHGGAVVHVKFYPDSATSMVQLLAHAVWHPDAGRTLLQVEPEAKLASVLAGLRQVSRLRATLMVVEDIHLLEGDALKELAQVLAAVAEETLSLLCLARPVELPARAVLERYLVEEAEVKGLTEENCGELWMQVMGAAPEAAVSAALCEATMGNPLAIRSALRSAVKSGTVKRQGESDSWQLADDVKDFTRRLKGSVDLLAEGMTAHLTEEELYAAQQLACLGEVFSREAAEVMIDDAEKMIERLMFKGVLHVDRSHRVSLPGPDTRFSLIVFSHTLLHQQLCVHIRIGIQLVKAIASTPIYSSFPLRLIATHKLESDLLDFSQIGKAYERGIDILKVVLIGNEWKFGEHIWRACARLFSSQLSKWGNEQYDIYLARLWNMKISVAVRSNPNAARDSIDYFLSITDTVPSEEWAQLRLSGLAYKQHFDMAKGSVSIAEIWEQAESLVMIFPHLCVTDSYVNYLQKVTVAAFRHSDVDMLRCVEARISALLETPGLRHSIRRIIHIHVQSLLMNIVENEEDYVRQLLVMRSLEELYGNEELDVQTRSIPLLYTYGMIDELIVKYKMILPQLRKRGRFIDICTTTAAMNALRAGISIDSGKLEEELSTLIEDVHELYREDIGKRSFMSLLDVALLLGDIEWSQLLFARYTTYDDYLYTREWVELAINSIGPPLQMIAHMGHDVELKRLLSLILEEQSIIDYEHVFGVVRDLLLSPFLGLPTIFRRDTIIALIDTTLCQDGTKSLPADVRMTIGVVLGESLEWLAAPERGLFAFMSSILDRYPHYFANQELTYWRKRIDEIRRNRETRERARRGDGRIRISMLGTISVQKSDEEPQRFQGARIKTLLAMMTIQQMLDKPLSNPDFCRLVAGDESFEIEHARDIVKKSVYRLRESLGHEAVLTDGETPRLNPELVQVDLLDIHEQLQKVHQALRSGTPMQAKQFVVIALEKAGAEVAFPSLYHSFIEAAREEHENRLRTAALETSQVLLREGAIADASDLLRKLFDVLQGDEEIADLLRAVLLQQGQYTEAERVRMRVTG